MRKNGINRHLTPIEGGVCAPGGFRCSATYCGFDKENDGKDDLAFVVADKRCATACVYTTLPQKGAPIAVTKRHLKNGYAQAFLANSGIANVFMSDGEKLAEYACRKLRRYINVDAQDVVIASTGKMFGELTLEQFEGGLQELVENLSDTHEASLAAARALMTTDAQVKQLSYSFELGAFSCKIGAIFKGNTHVAPNMATTLAFITTDVNITPEMLRHALVMETKESFNLLNVDGQASPNDMVCIMANGRAGNCRIDRIDTEYKKFAYILREVLIRICKQIVTDDEPPRKVLSCKVIGALSKQLARAVAREVVYSSYIRRCAKQGQLDLDKLFHAILNAGVELDGSLEIYICADGEEVVVFEDEQAFANMEQQVARIFAANERTIVVNLHQGNYTAEAYGCDDF